MDRLAEHLRRTWYTARRRWRGDGRRLLRLVVEKARWLNDARSPVVLMIDDLANVWHSHSGGARWEAGGDWGGGCWDSASALSSLEQGLLKDFPEARTTFFVVAGALSAYTTHQPFSHSAPIDATDESRAFFSGLARDPRFELAYHGYNHGTPGATTAEFVQEWRGFPDRATALEQTRKGLEIFERATGSRPRGGKYGGWDYNEFAEEIVDASGFDWWCRDWMPRDYSGRVAPGYYEPQYFGPRLLVGLPSTVHGYFWARRQIDVLLRERQVIAIEEHIAPVRPDGLIQTPNIIDDMEQLRRLYAYLRGHDVWHANCSEIADYVAARDQTLIYDVTDEGFSIRCDGAAGTPLTLTTDCSAICSADQPSIEVIAPDGSALPDTAYRFDLVRHRHLVTVRLQPGRYRVRPTSARR